MRFNFKLVGYKCTNPKCKFTLKIPKIVEPLLPSTCPKCKAILSKENKDGKDN